MTYVRYMEAGGLTMENWQDLQGIAREAFGAAVDRPQADIDALVHWGDPEAFASSRRDPNELVGEEFVSGQEFSRPHVAIAMDGNVPVGYLYAADNVSGGSPTERRLKYLSIVKRHLWLREVAVLPEAQNNGVARQLGRSVLRMARDRQPVSAYVWPDLTPGIYGKLTELGFVETGDTPVHPFGPRTSPVRQVRLAAKSVSQVAAQLG